MKYKLLIPLILGVSYCTTASSGDLYKLLEQKREQSIRQHCFDEIVDSIIKDKEPYTLDSYPDLEWKTRNYDLPKTTLVYNQYVQMEGVRYRITLFDVNDDGKMRNQDLAIIEKYNLKGKLLLRIFDDSRVGFDNDV
ncbi:hypothetical protein ACFL1H_07560, partial [Nanoarchaeota archaeon]